nr:helix-turn-helix transcriptional regulator [Methylobacterium sp. ZNC0032]
MTRTERLRLAKGWTQPQLAEFLGVRQATISRLENGQAESGPVSRLLDLLESQIGLPPPAALTTSSAPERAA